MTRTVMLAGIGFGLTILGTPSVVTLGAAYSFTFKAFGGVGPFKFTETGSLPSGLTFTDNGNGTATIAGTTSTPGNFPITITLSDASRTIVTASYTLTVQALPLSITNSAPNGTIGTAYSFTYTATGGISPYTWSVQSGSLPAGLSLNTSTGAVTGTPTTSTNYPYVIAVTDSATPTPGTTSLSQSVTIGAAPLSVSGTFTMNAKTGALDGSPSISGGTAPYFVSVHSGTAPSPITFGVSGSTATASGTCTTIGKYSWTLRFTDSGGSTPVDVSMSAMLAWYTLQFQAGGLGNVFDFNDLSTMYQDTAGTTPVTTVGQTIGSIRCKLTGNLAVLKSGKTLTLALDSTLGAAGYYCASVGTAANGNDSTDYIFLCSGGVPSALLGDSVNGLGLVGLMEYDTGVQGVATFIGSYTGAGSSAATGNIQADGVAEFLQYGSGYGVGTAYSNGKTYVIGSKGIRSGGSANIRVKSNANTQGASTSSIANIATGDFRIGAGISSGKKIYCAMAISREFTSTDYTNMPSQFFAL